MLEELLRPGRLSVVFQPIVNLLTGDAFGFEALGRAPAELPEVPGYRRPTPGELLDLAHAEGRLLELDRTWRRLAIEAAARSGVGDAVSFFLNLDTRIFDLPAYRPGFTRATAERNGLSPARLVLELTERDDAIDGHRLAQLVPHYAAQGFRIALDDLGAAYASLTAMVRLRPQLLKLDRELVQGLAQDPVRQNLIRALAEFARRSGMQLLAEGIETVPDLKALLRAGVILGQGYLIARPAPEVVGPPEEVRRLLAATAAEVQRARFHSIRTLDVGSIVQEHPSVPPTLSGTALERRFRADPSCVGYPVVDLAGRAIGLVMRDRFVAAMGGRYGYALHADRPIAEIMDRHALRVEARMPIEQVSRLATARSGLAIYDLVLVERDGAYVGVVTVRSLLEATTELEIQHAQYASPLTGLPGNVVIEQKIATLLDGPRGDAWFVWADLDRFKGFNDRYGFAAGDEVIRLLAALLQEVFAPPRFEDAFVGHVGGDDFVLAGEGGPIEEALGEVASLFDQRVRLLHAPGDLEKGGFVAVDRQGEVRRLPPVGLSLALVTAADLRRRDVLEVSRVAAELKCRAKSEARLRGGGSGWVRERRRPPATVGDAPAGGPLRTGEAGSGSRRPEIAGAL